MIDEILTGGIIREGGCIRFGTSLYELGKNEISKRKFLMCNRYGSNGVIWCNMVKRGVE